MIPIKDLSAVKSVVYNSANQEIVVTTIGGDVNTIPMNANQISFSNNEDNSLVVYENGLESFIYTPTPMDLINLDESIHITKIDEDSYQISCADYVTTAINNAQLGLQI